MSRDSPITPKVLFASIAVSVAVAVTQIYAAALSGSVAALGKGLDSVVDVAALTATAIAVLVARRPADEGHPWGHGKAENLAAFGQAVLLGVTAIVIAAESLQRFNDPAPEPTKLAVALIVGAMFVDLILAVVLARVAGKHSSQALAASAANIGGDTLMAVAVLTGMLSGVTGADAVAGLFVAVVMLGAATAIARVAGKVLMDTRSGRLDDRLGSLASLVDGVTRVAATRVRRAGQSWLAEIDVEVPRATIAEAAQEIRERVAGAIEEELPGIHATINIQPSTKGETAVGKTLAAATRLGLADQVHNVLVIAHPEGLWIMLHAKVAPRTQLGRAHAISDELERALRKEIEGVARIEIHLEPREAQALTGKVVSATRSDIQQAAQQAIAPPLTGVHEVGITEVEKRLHVVLHCDAPSDASIEDVHSASMNLETALHKEFPEVQTVTVHFEPQMSEAGDDSLANTRPIEED